MFRQEEDLGSGCGANELPRSLVAFFEHGQVLHALHLDFQQTHFHQSLLPVNKQVPSLLLDCLAFAQLLFLDLLLNNRLLFHSTLQARLFRTEFVQCSQQTAEHAFVPGPTLFVRLRRNHVLSSGNLLRDPRTDLWPGHYVIVVRVSSLISSLISPLIPRFQTTEDILSRSLIAVVE